MEAPIPTPGKKITQQIWLWWVNRCFSNVCVCVWMWWGGWEVWKHRWRAATCKWRAALMVSLSGNKSKKLSCLWGKQKLSVREDLQLRYPPQTPQKQPLVSIPFDATLWRVRFDWLLIIRKPMFHNAISKIKKTSFRLYSVSISSSNSKSSFFTPKYFTSVFLTVAVQICEEKNALVSSF